MLSAHGRSCLHQEYYIDTEWFYIGPLEGAAVGPRWPVMGLKVSTSGPEDPRLEIRFRQRSAMYVSLVHLKSDVEGSNVLKLVWCGSLERGMSVQVSSDIKITRSVPK
ncbi:hypothetical protein AVEN_4025-1 [Araneus ventricosus]|uniref:Uncharacterized protein n=1 Tax=Araneus ventricosus TaxID=182803 RepID=A0A4Y2J6X3_ARAVE|nr:hypothetical protein AVEN_4025-1 [Araneus ventricosus]